MSALDKAFAQERAKVLEQGRVEGEAGLLLRQLTRRFGPLPTEVQSRVRHGRSEDLELWAERVLSASSLQAVFDDAR